MLFNAIDSDKDGLITRDQYGHAWISFYFNSGPDDAFSLFFGPVVKTPVSEEDDEQATEGGSDSHEI